LSPKQTKDGGSYQKKICRMNPLPVDVGGAKIYTVGLKASWTRPRRREGLKIVNQIFHG